MRELKLKIQTMDGPGKYGERLAKEIFSNAIVRERGGSETRHEKDRQL